jgi:hypothetical protein
MSRPALDVDMLVEMREYFTNVRDKLLNPKINALVEARRTLRREEELDMLIKVEDKLEMLNGMRNKNANFLRFVRHYLNLKKGDRE